MNDVEEQQNEILALSSILDSEILTSSFGKVDEKCETEQHTGRFVIDIDFPEPVRIEVRLKEILKTADLMHLPPIYCSFVLPLNYPSESNPEIDLFASWLSLPTAIKLKEKLHQLSSENPQTPILYLYYQYIKEETFNLMDKPLNLNTCKPSRPRRMSSLTIPSSSSTQNGASELDNRNSQHILAAASSKVMHYHHYTPEQLFDVLVDYNRLQNRKIFEQNIYTCQICFTDNYGSDCVQFTPCYHTFCRRCCKDFFDMLIKDGSFELLKCMATNCDSQATPQLIRDVVADDAYERYDRLTLTRSLDMMRDVVICPRPMCRSFVLLDADDPRMGWCSVCSFAFCTLCNKVYHGVAPCAITAHDVTNVIDEYNRGDAEARKRLEERFGKNTVRRLIEDHSSLQWQKENCQGCPCCRAPIEKKDGCNKMWCSKCGSYFCWLCQKSLPKDNPYSHFNDPNSTCFNALFRGVVNVDDDSDDDDF